MCHSRNLQSLALQKSSPILWASRYAPHSSSSISSSIARMHWARVSFGPGGVEVAVVALGTVVVVVVGVVGVVVVDSHAVVLVWLELFRFAFFRQWLAMWPCVMDVPRGSTKHVRFTEEAAIQDLREHAEKILAIWESEELAEEAVRLGRMVSSDAPLY